jgi:AraC-like DNA-binding protein/CheY-like chemotaxis protein
MTAKRAAANVERFTLVTAAHHFLMNVLPFRDPESHSALARFVSAIAQIRPSSAELDVVLLRCLVIMDMQHERRIPSLVDRYLAKALTPEESLSHFATCVEDLLRYRCITNGAVQQAVDIIGSRYSESSLDPRTVAEAMSLRLSTLDVAFKREMGCTMTEHIRAVRLERAALLLVTTDKSIKEIWAGVGYNHPSNFDHEFKRRFGLTPRQFRVNSVRPAARLHYGVGKRSTRHDTVVSPPLRRHVLIVDDDDTTRATLGTHLNHQGYSVSAAPTGNAGLRQVKETAPDVILLDYRLGDMDGVEFLRTLRHEIPGDLPPVALFTADWNAFDHREDIHNLNAVLESKLCDLTRVTQLIDDLSSRNGVPVGPTEVDTPSRYVSP